MKTTSFVMLGCFAVGCAGKDDADGLPPVGFVDGDADGGSECADYRAEYPEGPYGFAVGSVMADPPGMVDAAGAAQSLVDVFNDRTKMALVIANAFDT